MVPLQLDVSSDASIAAAAEQVRAVLSREGMTLWGLVNNAGVAGQGSVEEWSRELWQRTFEVNVFGAAAATRAFVPLLHAAGGCPLLHAAGEPLAAGEGG